MPQPSKYLAVLLVAAACTGGGEPMHLGSVMVVHSCSEAAAGHLERGLALLHNMTYEEAETAFATATEADPACGMGYWGQAMTFIHPLWSDPPSEETFRRGQALLEEGRSRVESDHERAYVNALAGYYETGKSDSETPNLRGFEAGWHAFHEAYPDDQEGKAFYALAQLGTVDPGDKTFSKQRAAGTLAEQVLAEVPDHPGAHHYIIHAYDNPPLSAQAGEVARSYSTVAPSVPHALHMPTHTFTRLGLWTESIDWNRRSADAYVAYHPESGQDRFYGGGPEAIYQGAVISCSTFRTSPNPSCWRPFSRSRVSSPVGTPSSIPTD